MWLLDGIFIFVLYLYVKSLSFGPVVRADGARHIQVSYCGHVLRDYWTTNCDEVVIDYRNGVFCVVTNKLW